jgi:putative hydrolase of the HAD superfamily
MDVGVDIISFDLDETLISVSFDKKIYNEMIPNRVADQKNISLEEAKQIVYAQYYEAKYVDQITNWTSIRRWLKQFNIDETEQILKRFRENAEPYDDVKETLPEFSEMAGLSIFTNTNPEFLRAKVEIPPLPEHIDTVRSGPYDYGLSKEDDQAWEAYLEDLCVKPNNIIHIGDSIQDDVNTPNHLGIKTYHLSRDKNTAEKGYESLKPILKQVKQ